MEIISYGAASKVGKTEADVRKMLGVGVEGAEASVKNRIDALEGKVQLVNFQANRLIINDAINIMKAHARLNAVAKSSRYQMHNMLFDDLLDLSGINTGKSSGYTHNSTTGTIAGSSGSVLVTIPENTEAPPTKVLLSVEVVGGGEFFISRNSGETFEPIKPDTLFYFSERISPMGSALVLKGQLEASSELLNYALTWA